MLRTITVDPKIAPRASVILLHGLGASGHDLADLPEHFALPEELGVRFVFPHAPIRAVKYANNSKMRAWFNFAEIKYHGEEDKVGIKESQDEVNKLILNEISLNIPSEKIVLAGFSQGGAMALQCGLRYPQKLAGILALSTWLPLQHTVLLERNIINQDIPILMLHGKNDNLIPLAWAQEGCNYLKEIGYNAEIFSYPTEHNICFEEISVISSWLKKVLS